MDKKSAHPYYIPFFVVCPKIEYNNSEKEKGASMQLKTISETYARRRSH